MTHDVCGINNPMYGKTLSQEERNQRAEKLKGRKKPDGFGLKVSAALKGKPKSPEAVAKKSKPITLVNVRTNEIRTFPSQSEMERELHCNTKTILDGGHTKAGWTLKK